MFNEERRVDLSDPWHKNAGCVSVFSFFVLLTIGLIIIMLI